MRTFEQVALALGQFLCLLGCAGSVIAFAGSVIALGHCAILSGISNPYRRGTSGVYWALVGSPEDSSAILISSIVGFLYSYAMWVVFTRVQKLQ